MIVNDKHGDNRITMKKICLALYTHITGIFTLCLIVVVLTLGIFGYWLSREAREVAWLSDYIISVANDNLAPYSVENSSVIAYLDWESVSLFLKMKEFNVINEKNESIIKLPQVTTQIKALPLVYGKAHISNLIVHNPRVTLYRQDNGSLSLELDALKESRALSKRKDEQGPSNKPEAERNDISRIIKAVLKNRLEVLTLKNPTLNLGSGNKKILMSSPLIRFEHRIDQDNNDFVGFSAELRHASSRGFEKMTNSTLSGALAINEDGLLEKAHVTFDKLAPHSLVPFDWRLHKLNALQMPLSGNATVLFDVAAQAQHAATIKKAIISLNGEQGVYSDDNFFDDEIRFNDVSIKATYDKSEQRSLLSLDDIVFNFNDGHLKTSGEIVWNKGEDTPAITMNAALKNVPASHVKRYWPKGAAPSSRTWVVNNIKSGIITKADLAVNIDPKDLTKKMLPDEAIASTLHIEDATLRYIPKMPELTDVDAIVRFSGQGMEVEAQSAKTMKHTELLGGYFAIPDFTAKGIPMILEAEIKSKANEVATAMSAKHLDVASQVNLKPDSIKGEVVGTLSLNLPLYSSQVKKYYVNYGVDAYVEAFSQKGLMKKWDAESFYGKLVVDNNHIEIDGSGRLQDTDVNLTVKENYGKDKSSLYKLKATLPVERFARFDIKAPGFITGTVGIDATVEEKKGKAVTDASFNLDDAVISLSDVHFLKPAGSQMKASLTYRQDDKNLYITELDASGELADINGDITVNLKTEQPTKIALSGFRMHRSKASLNYSKNDSSETLTIKGKVFDIAPWIGGSEPIGQDATSKVKTNNDKPYSFFDGKQINVEVEQLLLDKEKKLTNVKVDLDCRFDICKSAKGSANLSGNKTVGFTIVSSATGRDLEVTSDDAGALLAAINVSEHVKGGSLSYKASFVEKGVLKGRLLMGAFRIVDGPILGKLITLGSLSGFMDTLQGNGIHFKKLGVDMNATHAGKISFKDGRAYGNALGITADGKVNPFAETMDIEGTLVPSYTANTMLGKIPLLGDILTGGEGQGIIAMNYSLNRKTGEEIAVSVNPLSLLTPGFLRKLFDVFDGGQAAEPNERIPTAGPANRKANKRP